MSQVSSQVELLQKPLLLKSVLCLSTWELLPDDQKSQLFKLLPKSLTQEQQDETVRCLFSGENLCAFSSVRSCKSGNPIDDFIAKLEHGYYSKEACSLRNCHRQARSAKAKYERSRYYHKLLKEVIVSRQMLNDGITLQCHLAAVTFPQCYKLARSKDLITQPIDHEAQAVIAKSAEDLYNKILSDVKQEVKSFRNCSEEDLLSSESDADDVFTPNNQGSKSLSNGSTSGQIKDMLIQHQRRKTANVATPDMDLIGLKLNEVRGRAYGATKKSNATILRKRKVAESAKLSKQKKLKLSKQKKESKKEKKSHGLKERGTITAPSCYFELIRDVINLTNDHSLPSIQLLISDWLASAEASRYDWTNNLSNWKELVEPALEFLAKRNVSGNNDSPLLLHEDQSWTWRSQLNSDIECEILQDLCTEWLELVADQLVSPSAEGSFHSFHEQERRRFLYAHQAFVYNINGVRYPVAPVKGTAGPTKEGKVAREHSLLKSERPPQVTLIALTRDAVARLPRGRGPRTVVCSLLKDSQYLASGVTEAQITSAVSGALDRLHYEYDPCVQYNSSAKVWVYLHGQRTPEELERIHSEQLGTPKRKRSMKKSKLKNAVSKKKTATASEIQFVGINPKGGREIESNHISQHLSLLEAPKQNPPASGQNPTDVKVFGPAQKPFTTRTIQVTQKQLLEMTRKLSESSASVGAREVLLTQLNKTPNSPTPVVQGLLAHAQLPQTGLKLILKPSGDSTKSVADSTSSTTSHSHSNHQILSADALLRLTEQLSAMSSRPIKIVQRHVASPLTPSGPGSRIINITSRPGTKTAPISTTSSSKAALETFYHNEKTVAISSIGNPEMPSTEEPRKVHIVPNDLITITKHVEAHSSVKNPSAFQGDEAPSSFTS